MHAADGGSSPQAPRTDSTRSWRNRETRQVESLVAEAVGVRVPPGAPHARPRSSAAERRRDTAEAGGATPPAVTTRPSSRWQDASVPSWQHGFEPRRPFHPAERNGQSAGLRSRGRRFESCRGGHARIAKPGYGTALIRRHAEVRILLLVLVVVAQRQSTGSWLRARGFEPRRSPSMHTSCGCGTVPRRPPNPDAVGSTPTIRAIWPGTSSSGGRAPG